MERDLDPWTAGLEAQLDRLDDEADDAAAAGTGEPDRGDLDELSDGHAFHVEDADTPIDEAATAALPTTVDGFRPQMPVDADGLPDDDAEDAIGTSETSEALDELIIAFNHRDLDQLLGLLASDGEAPGLLGYDRDNLPDAVADLWERRPSVQLTRGSLEGDPVGVLWEHDGAAWWQLAVVTVDDVRAERVGVLEFADAPDLLDHVRTVEPDDAMLQGERWQEWDEGGDV